MAGFAFALALDTNEIHVEMHIELCYSLSRYRESHLAVNSLTVHVGYNTTYTTASSNKYASAVMYCLRHSYMYTDCSIIILL